MNEGINRAPIGDEQPTLDTLIESSNLPPEKVEKLQEHFTEISATEEGLQKAKWIINKLTTNNAATFEELEAQYEEERAKILTEGGFDDPDYTITTGKQEGAGAVNLGLERPEERGL